ncbi:MAG: hypothetical protein FWG87_10340 [Defluviitaleaceae bacterium]|nr:hypothetical protein [Defluviitaleaceae bacterium]
MGISSRGGIAPFPRHSYGGNVVTSLESVMERGFTRIWRIYADFKGN